MKETRAILSAYAAIKARGEACALATIVSVQGSSYRRQGARMLVDQQGAISGSVSGGCLERDLILRARRVLHSREPELIRYDTTENEHEDDREAFASTALGCNGVIEIWLEPIPPGAEHPALQALRLSVEERRSVTLTTHGFTETISPPVPLVIAGAGHDAVPMTELALSLGWHVTVVDFRSAYSMPSRRFASVDRYLRCTPEAFSANVALSEETLSIVMTHNYFHDLEILRALLLSPVRYIGLLGAKKRGERMIQEIGWNGDLSRFHSPVGLDIGAETPQEIALSAIAEAQAALRGASGESLRKREGPIHERIA